MISLINFCLSYRLPLLGGNHLGAFRLFNGFYEGIPGLVVDIFGKTLVINWHGESDDGFEDRCKSLQAYYLDKLPWLDAILVKARQLDNDLKRGKIIYGSLLQKVIEEDSIKYALDLKLNQDNTFYLDTRTLRKWLHSNMNEKSLLNTFAYTGSLGVAALAGGAKRVVQTDLNERFLALAKRSANLNHLNDKRMNIIVLDFFKAVDRLKTSKSLFDCVILDPPFFSDTSTGKIDLVNEYQRLVNKVRPLVGHDGWLVLINNALFLSGKDMMTHINKLSEGEYLRLQELIPVPEYVCGYKETIIEMPPTDPKPFNHPTKIAILKVRRKDERRAK